MAALRGRGGRVGVAPPLSVSGPRRADVPWTSPDPTANAQDASETRLNPSVVKDPVPKNFASVAHAATPDALATIEFRSAIRPSPSPSVPATTSVPPEPAGQLSATVTFSRRMAAPAS